MLRTLREALMYASEFRGKRFVVKLGEHVGQHIQETGILADIRLLSMLGIEIVLTHASSTDPRIAIQDPIYRNATTNLALINHCIRDKFVPVVQCDNDNAVTDIAIAIGADKLVFLTDQDGVFDAEKKSLVRQCVLHEAYSLLPLTSGGMRHKVENALRACNQGVIRVHIISGMREDAILEELFSSEGIGTMIYADVPYQEIRPATLEDFQAIKHTLLHAQITELIGESEIWSQLPHFLVLVIDKHIQGCMILISKKHVIEVSYLATMPTCKDPNAQCVLLEYALTFAKSRQMKYLIFSEDKNDVWLFLNPWFEKNGFQRHLLREIGVGRNTDTTNAFVLCF